MKLVDLLNDGISGETADDIVISGVDANARDLVQILCRSFTMDGVPIHT